MSVRILRGDVRDRLRDLPEWQAAYLAGLIDGEGSLESQREVQPRGATPRFVLRLSFTFATKEPLETVCGWLGIEYAVYAPKDPRRSPRYRAHVYKAVAVPLLRRVLPYLILKRRQAEIILAIEDIRAANTPDRRHVGAQAASRMPAAAIEKMTALHAELRSLKSHKKGRPKCP